MEQQKERIKVKLSVGGVYPMYPVKAEYKSKELPNGTVSERLMVRFAVQLGAAFSCTAFKSIFFKGKEHRDALNKEIKFLLKFICPDCLEDQIQAKDFKDYAEKLCSTINKELDAQGEQKRRVVLVGKIRRKKDSQFVEFSELTNKEGNTEFPYLAFPEQITSLYTTKWELDNCVVAFELDSYQPSGNGNGSSQSEPAVPSGCVSSGWNVSDADNKDMPF